MADQEILHQGEQGPRGPAAETEPRPAQMLSAAHSSLGRSLLQRKLAQRLARKQADGDGVAPGADQAVAQAQGSPGAPLPQPLQRKFEASLGADLSGVRVHTGDASAAAAESVSARAYAVGQDIHFAAGQYDPASREGEHLLAHEVAHTVQQAGGAARPQRKPEVSEPQDGAEVEADRAADAMVAGAQASAMAGGVGHGTSLMRDKDRSGPRTIHGNITEYTSVGGGKTRLIIDRGKNKGVSEESSVRLVGYSAHFPVDKVTEDECVVLVDYSVDMVKGRKAEINVLTNSGKRGAGPQERDKADKESFGRRQSRELARAARIIVVGDHSPVSFSVAPISYMFMHEGYEEIFVFWEVEMAESPYEIVVGPNPAEPEPKRGSAPDPGRGSAPAPVLACLARQHQLSGCAMRGQDMVIAPLRMKHDPLTAHPVQG